MAIGFTQIPQTLRLPFVFAEVDPSRANTGTQAERTLIIGQITSAGTATPNVPVLVQGVAWAKAACGVGSMLALMIEKYRERDRFGELWMLPVADNGSGVAATGTIQFTAAATAAGTLPLYVAGQKVFMAVTASQTTTQLATALAAAINANTNLPVTAASSTGTVTLTAKNKGPEGNGIDLRLAYGGAAAGEAMPTSLAVTITAMASGATAPVLTTALANLGDSPFRYICCPYTDSTSLNALRDAMALRWSWQRQQYGAVFGAFRGTVGERTTFGAARNDPYASIIGFSNSPDPSWIWAADYCAACADSLRADPALPLQTVSLSVKAPPAQLRDAPEDRNTLLFTGISTHTVDADGTVRIERAITTYQTNAAGQADDSFLNVERVFTLAFALDDIRSYIASTYSRAKLANVGQRALPGSRVVTTDIIKADIIARYRVLERRGFVQDAEAFRANLVVERNAQNTSRVDVLWPIVPIDQLRQVALLAQFRNATI